MTRHRRRTALAAAFAFLVTGFASALPISAQADDFCAYEDATPPTITGFSPSTVTLGLKPKKIEFAVQSQDECGVSGWSIDTPNRLVFFVYKQSPTDTLVPFRNNDAGIAATDVLVHDEAYNVETGRFTFQLLRATRWRKTGADPEPVEKGDRITIKGTLQRADWNKKAYVRFGESTDWATVQFRPANSDTWIPVKTVPFRSTGRVSTQVTVKREVAQDGWYRLHFAGTGNSSESVSAPDYVDVR